MASTTRRDLPLPEWKKLAQASGNRCAFPGCEKYLYIPGDDGKGDLTLGEAAHIIGSSRQGPRGDFDLSAEERDQSARNRILVCPDHHTVIDQRPRQFTVQVLLAMKAKHEAKYLPSKAESFPLEDITDTLRATFMPVLNLPSVVMSLPLANPTQDEGDIARSMRWPKDRSVVIPFIVREKRIYTFANLRVGSHPFVGLVAREEPEEIAAKGLWQDPEGHRRYVALLNKALTKHLGRFGIRYDRIHHRYWFQADREGSNRSVEYQSKQGRNMRRDVVRQRIRRSTGEGKEWYHLAAGIRFERMADEAWVLTIRPEFQYTSDGRRPLPPKQQGSKSTRRKSHIYNEQYLGLVHFWADVLGDETQHLTIKAGEQRIRIRCELFAPKIVWPGIPQDHRPYQPKTPLEGGLIELIEQAEAVAVLDGGDQWWEDEEGDL